MGEYLDGKGAITFAPNIYQFYTAYFNTRCLNREATNAGFIRRAGTGRVPPD